ncbi:MAG: GNAT family N-acetyltransferase [Oscillospiraceae bacterium]|nr:GNAT family N-acetyltransferase [Oscillospiraceae bacterium]
MLNIRQVRAEELDQLQALYEAAFPENERRPLDSLLQDTSGCAKVLSVLQEQTFVGMVVTLAWKDLLHIIYFAVEESLRDQGLGSEILHSLRDAYPDMRILVDVEQPEPEAENYAQRLRRVAFYLRNGYSQTQVRYNWEDCDYCIYAQGGDVTEEEFWGFWRSVGKAMGISR